MAEIIFTPEYLKVAEQYEKKFGREFDGIQYDTEDGIKVMQECIRTGKAYDLTNDPNFDPDAKY